MQTNGCKMMGEEEEQQHVKKVMHEVPVVATGKILPKKTGVSMSMDDKKLFTIVHVQADGKIKDKVEFLPRDLTITLDIVQNIFRTPRSPFLRVYRGDSPHFIFTQEEWGAIWDSEDTLARTILEMVVSERKTVLASPTVPTVPTVRGKWSTGKATMMPWLTPEEFLVADVRPLTRFPRAARPKTPVMYFLSGMDRYSLYLRHKRCLEHKFLPLPDRQPFWVRALVSDDVDVVSTLLQDGIVADGDVSTPIARQAYDRYVALVKKGDRAAAEERGTVSREKDVLWGRRQHTSAGKRKVSSHTITGLANILTLVKNPKISDDDDNDDDETTHDADYMFTPSTFKQVVDLVRKRRFGTLMHTHMAQAENRYREFAARPNTNVGDVEEDGDHEVRPDLGLALIRGPVSYVFMRARNDAPSGLPDMVFLGDLHEDKPCSMPCTKASCVSIQSRDQSTFLQHLDAVYGHLRPDVFIEVWTPQQGRWHEPGEAEDMPRSIPELQETPMTNTGWHVQGCMFPKTRTAFVHDSVTPCPYDHLRVHGVNIRNTSDAFKYKASNVVPLLLHNMDAANAPLLLTTLRRDFPDFRPMEVLMAVLHPSNLKFFCNPFLMKHSRVCHELRQVPSTIRLALERVIEAHEAQDDTFFEPPAAFWSALDAWVHSPAGVGVSAQLARGIVGLLGEHILQLGSQDIYALARALKVRKDGGRARLCVFYVGDAHVYTMTTMLQSLYQVIVDVRRIRETHCVVLDRSLSTAGLIPKLYSMPHTDQLKFFKQRASWLRQEMDVSHVDPDVVRWSVRCMDIDAVMLLLFGGADFSHVTTADFRPYRDIYHQKPSEALADLLEPIAHNRKDPEGFQAPPPPPGDTPAIRPQVLIPFLRRGRYGAILRQRMHCISKTIMMHGSSRIVLKPSMSPTPKPPTIVILGSSSRTLLHVLPAAHREGKACSCESVVYIQQHQDPPRRFECTDVRCEDDDNEPEGIWVVQTVTNALLYYLDDSNPKGLLDMLQKDFSPFKPMDVLMAALHPTYVKFFVNDVLSAYSPASQAVRALPPELLSGLFENVSALEISGATYCEPPSAFWEALETWLYGPAGTPAPLQLAIGVVALTGSYTGFGAAEVNLYTIAQALPEATPLCVIVCSPYSACAITTILQGTRNTFYTTERTTDDIHASLAGDK